MHGMRRLITLVTEAVQPNGEFYLHVSAGRNLSAILQHGLRQTGDGNYSGYETALSGVYVTCVPDIIRDHIVNREIENDFVLVVVRVGTPAVIDEDALDGWLQRAVDMVARKMGLPVDELVEEVDSRQIAADMLAPFKAALGPPSQNSSDDLLLEFIQAWIDERMIGVDGADGDWWAATKEQIVQSYPNLAHIRHGATYSLRLPTPVAFSGETRIVAVVHVLQGRAEVAAGSVPPAATKLVTAVVDSI